MATAGPLTNSVIWRKEGYYTVQLVQDDKKYIQSEAVLDCFLTDKEYCDFKPDLKDGIHYVQFPIPVDSFWNRIMQPRLKETVNRFLVYILKNYKYTILVPVDCLKSSIITEVCEVFLTSSIAIGTTTRTEITITFCAKELDDFIEAKDCCRKILPSTYEIKSYTNWHNDVKSDHSSVMIEEGSIGTIKADAIACTISRSMNLEDGAASMALLKQAGKELQHELNDRPDLKLGQIIELHGYRLKCRIVYLGKMSPWGHHAFGSFDKQEKYYRATIHEFVVECLQKAADRGFKSIAFPAIGSGNLGYPIDIVAEEMFETTHNWLYGKRRCSLKTVKFVIYPDDRQVLQAFKDQEQRYNKNLCKSISSTKSAKNGIHLGHNTTASNKYPANTTMNVPVGNLKGNTEELQKQTYRHMSSLAYMQNGKTYRTKENIIVKVYCGDLLKAQVDCIVNAANIKLKHGGGIARAIEAAAGKDLTREGHEYLKTHGHLQVGEACFTSAGKLNFRIVIHTVGPCWSDYNPDKQKDVHQCKTDLWSAVVNSLCLAEREGLTSIAFPAISSGKYGCPVDLCCVQYAEAVITYSALSKNPLHEIHVVDINQDIITLVQKTFDCMITQGSSEFICRRQVFPDYNVFRSIKRKTKSLGKKVSRQLSKKTNKAQSCVVKQNVLKYPSCVSATINGHPDAFCCAVGRGQNVFVYSDNLLTLQGIQIIALGETPNGKSLGRATQKFMEFAGDLYKAEKEKCFQTTRLPGDIVVCKGGRSNFKFVAHAILIPIDKLTSENVRRLKIKKLFGDIYNSMKERKCHSLALALFGTGKGKADPRYHAEIFIDSFLEFCRRETSYSVDIHLVHIESETTAIAIDVIKSVIDRQTSTASASFQSVPSVQNEYKSYHRSSSTGDIHHGSKQPKHVTARHSSTFYVELDRARNSLILNEQRNLSDREYRQDNANSKTNKHLETVSTASAEEQSLHTSSMGGSSDSDLDEALSESLSDKSDGSADPCVICMEDVTDPKRLPCGHIFCSDCIEEQFTYKEACPTCGKVFGTITGDQPDGDMKIVVNDNASCMGFEDVGRIEIFYSFQDGIQRADHPAPGEKYKGIRRTAYLPNNKRGKEICAMLQVAFDRKLVFTLGRSRTTGADGVITWNDIHHKTDPKPKSQFGYPDPTYLDRVTDELKIKGVTPADIPSLSASTRKR